MHEPAYQRHCTPARTLTHEHAHAHLGLSVHARLCVHEIRLFLCCGSSRARADFSPWNGIPEDPVNGSSHTILAPYWAHAHPDVAWLPSSSADGMRVCALKARQVSARGGDLELVVTEPELDSRALRRPLSAEGASVSIGGAACTVYEGSVYL
ncbi:PhzF family phenazine biosynthesis protein [archaeon]|nr:MAG: PhzF family phenazine biosynthesis protein [archaeon]